jgi:colanic acid/amylovoran biosynthesis protein
MPNTPVSVSITAATLSGNHGAEAMLLATVGRIRDRVSDATFNVFSYYPREDAARVKDPSVRVFSLTRTAVVFRLLPLSALLALLRRLGLGFAAVLFPADVRALAESRVQVDLAGVSFMESRRRFLAYNTLTLLPAFLLGVPVVKGAQAVGPFTTKMNRRLAQAFLGRCAAVFARGERSFAFLRQIFGDSPMVRRADDVAFLLEPRDSLTGGAAPGRAHLLETIELRRHGKRSVVGLCPSSLLAVKDPKGYPALMAALVTALVTAGDLVVLFPNATRGRFDAGPSNNDLHVISQVLDALHADVRAGVVPVEGDVGAVDIYHVVQTLDMVVTSRFHAMVKALSLGKPTVVVGWSHKYMEVMEEFGLGRHVLHDAGATLPLVMALVDEVRSELPKSRALIESRLPGVRRSALEQIEFVADRLRS